MTRLFIAVLTALAVSCSGCKPDSPPVVSGVQDAGSGVCAGYSWRVVSQASARSLIVTVFKPDGKAPSLTFEGEGDTKTLGHSLGVIVRDPGEATVTATLKAGRVCLAMGPEDGANDACIDASLRGGLCLDLK